MKFNTLILDMDGTLADTYSISCWLDRLRKHDASIFIEAKTLISPSELYSYIQNFESVFVVSMVPWIYDEQLARDTFRYKLEWLDLHYSFLSDRFILLTPSDNKNFCNYEIIDQTTLNIPTVNTRTLLIDDSEELRSTFNGIAIYPPWL